MGLGLGSLMGEQDALVFAQKLPQQKTRVPIKLTTSA